MNFFIVNPSSYSIDFLINVFGIMLGGLLTLIIFQWQRIRKEQAFAKILINILKEGEIREFVERFEDIKAKYDPNDEEESLNMILDLKFITLSIIHTLPNLQTSYEIGTGYVYEIYDLRRVYSYFESMKRIVEFSLVNQPQTNKAYKDTYSTINKLAQEIPDAAEVLIEKLRCFEKKSPVLLALLTFWPFYNILDKNFHKESSQK